MCRGGGGQFLSEEGVVSGLGRERGQVEGHARLHICAMHVPVRPHRGSGGDAEPRASKCEVFTLLDPSELVCFGKPDVVFSSKPSWMAQLQVWLDEVLCLQRCWITEEDLPDILLMLDTDPGCNIGMKQMGLEDVHICLWMWLSYRAGNS